MKSCEIENCLNKKAVWILYFVVAVSPFISLYAGLSLALFFVIAAVLPTVIAFKTNIYKDILKSDVYKVVLFFLGYCLISAIWAIRPDETVNLFVRMTLFFLGFIALLEFIKSLEKPVKDRLLFVLLCGYVVALAAANLEIIAGGPVTRLIHSFKSGPYKYELTDLNRGASYLSILFWPVFSYLIVKKKWLYAALMFLFAGTTLLRLESQTSSMALILSACAFVFIYALGKKGIKVMMPVAAFAVIAVAVTAYHMDPAKMFKIIPQVPNSAAEYRLYIWDFAAKKAAEKPIFGWGFNASRSMTIKESDFVLQHRHPLPLHPHNNVLQVWLELGVVGLFIFIAFLWSVMQSIYDTKRSENSHCLTHVEIGNKVSCANCLRDNMTMALLFALFASYFAIGETGYGMWQNWWVASGLIATLMLNAVVRE